MIETLKDVLDRTGLPRRNPLNLAHPYEYEPAYMLRESDQGWIPSVIVDGVRVELRISNDHDGAPTKPRALNFLRSHVDTARRHYGLPPFNWEKFYGEG